MVQAPTQTPLVSELKASEQHLTPLSRMSQGSGLPQIEEASSVVGCLCNNLPGFVTDPPVEAVVFGWGVAEDGQLGVDSEAPLLIPKVVEALLGTRLRGRQFGRGPLIGGSRCTLAIDHDGGLMSWGWNARCTLGHGHRGTERKPRRIAALRGSCIVQACIGGWHCLAVAHDGQAYAWGGNEYLQCGMGHGQRDIPSPTPCLPGLKVQQVAAGGMHSVALTEDGQVWTWGEPWGEFSMQVDRAPRQVEGASGIAKIACGAFHNLALTRGGEVFSWGINDYGQLGDETTNYATCPVKVVGQGGIGIADISAAGWHSIAITQHGEVYVWGRGEYGRLGLGDKSGSSKLHPAKVQGLEGHRVTQASCGGTHSMVLTGEGRMFTWGRGSFGRLGTGLEKDCYSPVEVFLPGGPERWRVISISCGGRHSLALALPDNGRANNRQGAIRQRSVRQRLTSDGQEADGELEADGGDSEDAEARQAVQDDEDEEDEDDQASLVAELSRSIQHSDREKQQHACNGGRNPAGDGNSPMGDSPGSPAADDFGIQGASSPESSVQLDCAARSDAIQATLSAHDLRDDAHADES